MRRVCAYWESAIAWWGSAAVTAFAYLGIKKAKWENV